MRHCCSPFRPMPGYPQASQRRMGRRPGLKSCHRGPSTGIGMLRKIFRVPPDCRCHTVRYRWTTFCPFARLASETDPIHRRSRLVDPLLRSPHGPSGYTGERLNQNLRILLARAGIKTAEVRLPRVHDFRHRCAVNVIDRVVSRRRGCASETTVLGDLVPRRKSPTSSI